MMWKGARIGIACAAISIVLATAGFADEGELDDVEQSDAEQVEAFVAAYQALQPREEGCEKAFAALVARHLSGGVPADQFLGFMVDAGFACTAGRGPIVPPARAETTGYHCARSALDKGAESPFVLAKVHDIEGQVWLVVDVGVDQSRTITAVSPMVHRGSIGAATSAVDVSQRTGDVEQFVVAYVAIDVRDDGSSAVFQKAVERFVQPGISADKLLGLMLDSGFSCAGTGHAELWTTKRALRCVRDAIDEPEPSLLSPSWVSEVGSFAVEAQATNEGVVSAITPTVVYGLVGP